MKKPDPLTKKLFERTLGQQAKRVTSRLSPRPKGSSQGRVPNKYDCRKCQNFFITWEKQTPYGCKAHGFKSAKLPSDVVLASSGQDCLFFKSK